MVTKITSISPIVVVCIIFGTCLSQRAAADVLADKAQIDSLIDSGKLTEAHSQIEKLKSDYAENSQLPYALFWIGRKLEWSNSYDEAKDIYQHIMENHPADSFAERARIGLARVEVLTLIVSHQFDEAQVALDKLPADFAGNPDLPGSLYWIANGYRWADKGEKASYLYQQIIQNYADSPYAARARLALARQEVLSLIRSWDYGRAHEALEKLVTDFAENPNLPEELYRIAREYEWAERYEDANSIYEHILQRYPTSSTVGKAQLGIARIEVCLVIVSGQIEASEVALAELRNNFAGHPDLGDTLHEVAKAYDYQDYLATARGLHGAVAADYPDKEYGSRAALDQAKVAILELIEANDFTAAEAALTEMKQDFALTPILPERLLDIAERCAKQGKTDLAVRLYEDILDSYSGFKAAPWVYDAIIDYRFERKAYPEALEYAERLCRDWPDSERAWHAQFMVGYCAEKLGSSGQSSRDDAESLTKDAYETILREYPNCEAADYARSWLKRYEHNIRVRKGRK